MMFWRVLQNHDNSDYNGGIMVMFTDDENIPILCSGTINWR